MSISNEDRKKKIIDEISSNRLGLYELLKTTITNRESLDGFKLVNDDFRSRGPALSRAAEIAKTKTEATISELNIRKTIDASVKMEFELLTKFEDGIMDNNDGINVDIRLLSKQLKKFEQNEQTSTETKD